MSDPTSVLAEALFVYRHSRDAYEFASSCTCGPHADCYCPEPTDEEMQAGWTEVRACYAPDLEEAQVGIDWLRNAGLLR